MILRSIIAWIEKNFESFNGRHQEAINVRTPTKEKNKNKKIIRIRINFVSSSKKKKLILPKTAIRGRRITTNSMRTCCRYFSALHLTKKKALKRQNVRFENLKIVTSVK